MAKTHSALVIGDDLMRSLHHTNGCIKRGGIRLIEAISSCKTTNTYDSRNLCLDFSFSKWKMLDKKRKRAVLTLYSCSRLFHFLMIFDSGNGTWSSRSTTLMKVKDEHKERKKAEKKRKENECTSVCVYMKKKTTVPIKLTNVLWVVYKFASKKWSTVRT